MSFCFLIFGRGTMTARPRYEHASRPSLYAMLAWRVYVRHIVTNTCAGACSSQETLQAKDECHLDRGTVTLFGKHVHAQAVQIASPDLQAGD